MYNPTLVPIDISESGLTEMVIPHVQRHTVLNTTKSIFLPSFLFSLLLFSWDGLCAGNVGNK
jgi:hypothetical protein